MLLHCWLVLQLPPGSPGLSCSSPLRPPGRDAHLALARLWYCLSRQPGSVPSLLPSCSQLSSPAQMDQSCLFGRQAARTSYSHQRRCQLRRLGRYSSSLPGGCRKTSAGAFHVLLVTQLGLPLLSPIAVPPAKVKGTFLLIACKPASSSHSLFCSRSFAKGTHSSDPKVVVEKGPEGSGHHLDGTCRRAAGDKGDTTLTGLTRHLGKIQRARFHVAHEQTSTEMSDRGASPASVSISLRSGVCAEGAGACGGAGRQRERAQGWDMCRRWIPAPRHVQRARACFLLPWEGPSPRSAEQALFPPSPFIVLPSPLLTYL